MDHPSVIKNAPLAPVVSGGVRGGVAFTHGVRQVHPAFQKTTNRYTQQRPEVTMPSFNASAMSPMFYGYADTPFSKL
ncbi:hypothetical protein INT47_003100 [Mucor saturninus]|uniref:Uncharacterized protein n=1 Tax=Mucor saturninus TaxID=64648 RepID=A0A8H7QRM6_9FUNG|nr:hypothetical protein INT47_003100 [Mucor saturninus]